MKTSVIKTGVFAASLFTLSALTPVHSINNNQPQTVSINHEVEIEITIDKNTKNAELKEITESLKKHNIEASFNKVKRNDKGEIIGLKISLKDDKGNESSTSLSSTEPINTITLGVKKDGLYISSANSKKMSFNGTHSLSKHFDFSFDEDEDVMIINGKEFNIDELKNKMKDAFVFEEGEDGKKMILKFEDFDIDIDREEEAGKEHKEKIEKRIWVQKQEAKKYQFIDDPEIEKYIVIDGKAADFKKLDQLAKDDKLEHVDFLKSETAMSVYGKKAKDGAIIATTKK